MRKAILKKAKFDIVELNTIKVCFIIKATFVTHEEGIHVFFIGLFFCCHFRLPSLPLFRFFLVMQLMMTLYNHITPIVFMRLTWYITHTHTNTILWLFQIDTIRIHFIITKMATCGLFCYILQGDKNIIKFEGDHNSPRPQFYFDSINIFFHNVLQPPEDEVRRSLIDTSLSYLDKV